MSNTYIEKEVAKVIAANSYPESMALVAAWIIAHFKGVNLKIYDAKETSSLCDYNIVASADNIVQAKSMVDEMISNFHKHKLNIISLEGMAEAEWILLDVGDVIIHIFQDVARDVFDLDSLWADTDQLKIPEEFYFGSEESGSSTTRRSSNNYF